jgi:translation initiation factor 1
MTIDLSNFDMAPQWSQTTPSRVPSPKKNQSSPSQKNDGTVRVGRETKGRKGAGVTVISGLPVQPDELAKLAKQFKQKCGTGGTVKNGVIEIQGDQRDVLIAELATLGYKAKRSGG